jgi:hypothetical protein
MRSTIWTSWFRAPTKLRAMTSSPRVFAADPVVILGAGGACSFPRMPKGLGRPDVDEWVREAYAENQSSPGQLVEILAGLGVSPQGSKHACPARGASPNQIGARLLRLYVDRGDAISRESDDVGTPRSFCTEDAEHDVYSWPKRREESGEPVARLPQRVGKPEDHPSLRRKVVETREERLRDCRRSREEHGSPTGAGMVGDVVLLRPRNDADFGAARDVHAIEQVVDDRTSTDRADLFRRGKRLEAAGVTGGRNDADWRVMRHWLTIAE